MNDIDMKLLGVFDQKLRSMWPHPDPEIHTRWEKYLETLKEIGIEKYPWGTEISDDEIKTLCPLDMTNAFDLEKPGESINLSLLVMKKETALKILTIGLP